MTTRTRAAGHPILTLVFVSIAFLLGTFAAVQARINGQLGIALGSHVHAALISFSVGLLALCVLCLVAPSMRAGLERIPGLLRRRELLPWHLIGGIAGACFVMAQVYAAPLIGVALFTVVGVASESLTALMIDRFGLSPGGRFGLSATRIVATVLVFFAVILASVDKLDVLSISLIALAVVFVARVGTTVQVTFNAKVAVATDSYLAASLVSFLAGAVFLAIVFLTTIAVGAEPNFEWQPWWLYTGGLIGLLIVAGGTVCIPRIGVLLYGLAGVGGSIIGSVLVDFALPFEGAGLTGWVVAGSILALVGILTAAGPVRLRRV